MKKSFKASLVLSSLLLGAVNLTASDDVSSAVEYEKSLSGVTKNYDKDIEISSSSNSNYTDLYEIETIKDSTIRFSAITSAESNKEIKGDTAGINISKVSDSELTHKGNMTLRATGSEEAYAGGFAIGDDYATKDVTTFENSSFENSGTIDIEAKSPKGEAYAGGIDIFGKVDNSSTIKNSGTIKVYAEADGGEADAYGIFIQNIVDSKVENSGNITVNIDTQNAKNLDEVEAYGIFTKELNGTSIITNSGTIEAKIDNKLDKYGYSIVAIKTSENSKITNEANGKLYGNIYIGPGNDAKTTTFENKGFISLPYNATNTNFANFVNSGTVEIGAFKNSSNNIEHTQIFANSAKFEAGSQMQVNVVRGSEAFVEGDTLSKVLTTNNKLNELIEELTMVSKKVEDNSAILDFEYKIIDDNQIDLVVSKVEKIQDVVSSRNPNIGSVGSSLDKISSYPKMNKLNSAMQSLKSEAELEKAMESLIPTTAVSAVNASSNTVSSISNVVSTRTSNSKSGLNSGDEMVVNGNKLWAKVYGGIGKQDDKGGISGFDLKSYGLGLGYDKEYKDGQIFGMGAFYTYSDIETNGVNQKNEIGSYSLALYGSNLLKDEKTTVYYQTSYTWQKNDSERELFTGDIAKADYTSKTFSIESKVGHKISFGQKYSIEPNIGLAYMHFSNPSYSENNDAGMKIDKFSSTELLGKVGADFVYSMTERSSLTANLGLAYNFHDTNRTVTSSFVGAADVSFDTKGIDNGDWKYEAGVGYALNLDDTNSLNLDYSYQGAGSKFRNNVISFNYNYKF